MPTSQSPGENHGWTRPAFTLEFETAENFVTERSVPKMTTGQIPEVTPEAWAKVLKQRPDSRAAA